MNLQFVVPWKKGPEGAFVMKAVLLTGAGIALVDGVVLGVALGVGRTGVAAAALAVGLASAVVLALLTPAAPPGEPVMVTLGVRPTAQPAEPEPDVERATLPGPAAAAPPTPAQTPATQAPAPVPATPSDPATYPAPAAA
ncbi:hypothetical protein [Xylanimonas sp. McL0601]|uniref:hypothetical protein n=1 Tax=Xylanimonas sp. McL0601 TaxID=3414739 RepID=UPI003CF8165E